MEPIGSLQEKNFKEKMGVRKGAGHPAGCPAPQPSLVAFIAYCLNSNHYHFILKQLVDSGISEFMKRLGGYAKYFNIKYKRVGSLFQ